MNPERGKSSSIRRWLLLIGGLVVFAVLFDFLSDLTRPKRVVTVEGSTPAADAAAARSPDPPRLRRLDDGAIKIEHDSFAESTIRMRDEEDSQAMFDCLSEGIEQTFRDGTAGWTVGNVQGETARIKFECLRVVRNLPEPRQQG